MNMFKKMFERKPKKPTWIVLGLFPHCKCYEKIFNSEKEMRIDYEKLKEAIKNREIMKVGNRLLNVSMITELFYGLEEELIYDDGEIYKEVKTK